MVIVKKKLRSYLIDITTEDDIPFHTFIGEYINLTELNRELSLEYDRRVYNINAVLL